MSDSLPASEPGAEPLESPPTASENAAEPAAVLPPPASTAPPGANGHANPVGEQALVLFDRTQPLHDLGDNSRRVLVQAVRLSGLTIPQARKNPYKAALELVRARADLELAEEDQAVLAAVLALHAGKLKRRMLAELDLSPVQARQALTIAALLRLALGLNHSGDGQTVIQKVKLTPEGMWIVVAGPHAEADAPAAQRAARLWTRIGYPEVEVLEAGEAAIRMLPLPEPQERIGVQADDALAEAGRKVLRFHFARMLSLEDGTRRGEDPADLHHMRVATRRLRAAFDVFASAFEPGALTPYRRGLRRIGRALGRVRDLDVFMGKARQYSETLPDERRLGLGPLTELWAGQRDVARAELLDYLDSAEYADFKRKFNIFLNTPGAGVAPLAPDEPTPQIVRELAPVLIYQRLAAVRAYAPFLDQAPIEMLHMLRIEFKKLRYTVEYFQEALDPRRSKVVIDQLKQLQDHLGDLNDADVAAHLLRRMIDEWETRQDPLPIHARQDLGEVVGYLAYRHAERHRLMASFQTIWEKNFASVDFRKSLAQAIAVL